MLEIGRTILLEQGVAQLTLRNVARTAGIRLFNLQHYFPSQTELLRAAIVQTIKHFETAAIEQLDGPTSRAPKTLFVDTCRYYLRLNRKRHVRILFFELGALAQRDEVVQRILHDAYQPYRDRLNPLIEAVNPELTRAERARRVDFITAALEGTMYVLNTQSTDDGDEDPSEKRFLSYLLTIATS
ncbi:TetR family transcriptional regulator [Pandoraea sp. SD6-2]|nr:TetR family transcriptional regulator [Pandoraea sp. SD6-2]